VRVPEGEATRGEDPDERDRSTFDVAVAETGYHDQWQRTELGVAAVGAQGYHLRKVLHSVQRFVDRWAEVEVISGDVTLHSPDD
jgi:uncharacterized protein YlxP (DUF503 family)